MQLKRFENVEEFYKLAEPFLLEREAEHNLILGICANLRRSPASSLQPQPYLAIIQKEDVVVAVAVMTPPRNLVLSHTMAPECLSLFVSDLCAEYQTLPGVLGPSKISKAFAEHWQKLSTQPYRLGIKQRIYQLNAVKPVVGASGQLRRATEVDRDLLISWISAFNREALGEDDASGVENVVNWFFKIGADMGGLYLWQDQRPVSMAGYSGPTPNGIRINAVYTPPEHRRRGYASACVAALSQLLLDSGRKFCFLFTDLSNPSSNHIYQVIGYTPVCDVDEYKFIT
jgi:predicted GNAT family acetyltransferase